MLARLSGAVACVGSPLLKAALAKLKVNVCQALATVVVASVSQVLVTSVASSTFRRIFIPAAGAHTLRVMVLALAVKGIFAIE